MEYLCNAFSRRNPLFIGSCSDMKKGGNIMDTYEIAGSQSPLYRVMQ